MKTITISAPEEEIWGWKEAAVRERQTLSEWIRGRLLKAGIVKVPQPVKQEKPIAPVLTKAEEPQDKKPVIKGVEPTLTVPANTVAEAEARVAELAAKKKREAEDLKRFQQAGKDFKEHYGTK